MIRPAGSLEVYKQKQNILFIFESVEHKMFKVTWARLCVCRAYARPSARAYARPSVRVGRMHGRVLGRMHGRVCVSGVCTAECACGAYARPSARVGRMHGRVRVSSVCTAECSGVCTAWRSVTTTWTGVRVKRMHGRVLGRMRSLAVRDNGLDGRATRWFVSPRPGYSFCTTRMGARLGLVVVHDLVGTRPRFGRDAYGLNFMGMIEPCGWFFRNVHMQLKVNACN